MLSDRLQEIAERFERCLPWGAVLDKGDCQTFARELRALEGEAMALERATPSTAIPVVPIDGVRVVSLDAARERRAAQPVPVDGGAA